MNNWGITVLVALMPLCFACHRVGPLEGSADGSPEGEGESEEEIELGIPAGGFEALPGIEKRGEVSLRRNNHYAFVNWQFSGRFGKWETVPPPWGIPYVDTRTTPDGTTCHVYFCEGEYCGVWDYSELYVGEVGAFAAGYPDTEQFELEYNDDYEHYHGDVCGFLGDADAPCPGWVDDDVDFTVSVQGSVAIPAFEAVNRLPQEIPVLLESFQDDDALNSDSSGDYHLTFSSGPVDQVEMQVHLGGDNNCNFLLLPDAQSGEILLPASWLEELGCDESGSVKLDAVNTTEISDNDYSITVKAINSVSKPVQFI